MELSEDLVSRVKSYRPDAKVTDVVRHEPMLFIVGVSGAGKDTVGTELLRCRPDQYHRIVTHTTRKPRENLGVMEQEGVDYHFVTFEQASSMLDEHKYVEANVYSGNIYGTSVAEIEQATLEKRIAYADIDVNGVEKYVKLAPQTVKAVFLLPPSYEVWQERLLRRYDGRPNQADLQKRLRTAYDELAHALQADHFHFVVNDNLDRCVQRIDQIAHGQTESQHNFDAKVVAQALLTKLQTRLSPSLATTNI